MTKDTLRGTGRTTNQIINAPLNAIYVWCNSDIVYPKNIALKNNRADIKFYRASSLEDDGLGCFRGLNNPNVIFDHAFFDLATKRMKENYFRLIDILKASQRI